MATAYDPNDPYSLNPQTDEFGNPINAALPSQARTLLTDQMGGNTSPLATHNPTTSAVAPNGPGTIKPGGYFNPATGTFTNPGDPGYVGTGGIDPKTGLSNAGTLAGDTTTHTDPNDVGAQIDALYAKAGLKDGGQGSGFADRAYWLAHPSEVTNGRLAADLAGTGNDQPTGTPGTGPWQNSGKNAPPGWGGTAANSTRAALSQPIRSLSGFMPSGAAPSVDPASANLYPSIAGVDLNAGPTQLQALLNRLATIAHLNG